MPDLDLVTIVAGGTDAVRVGGLRYTAGTIVPEGDAATGMLDTLRRRTRLADDQLWLLLADEGWSNGYIMTRAA